MRKSILIVVACLTASALANVRAQENGATQAELNSNLNADAALNSDSGQANAQVDAQGSLNAQSGAAGNSASANQNAGDNLDAGVGGTAEFSPQNSANSSQVESWRFRDYDGRKWYWQGDRKTGGWTYWNNGQWVPYNSRSTASGQASGITQNQQRSSGYRGTMDNRGMMDNRYHGPFYFDQSGRRYTQDGNSYIPDQNWNSRVWNSDFGNTYRNIWNTNAVPYNGDAGAGAYNSSGANLGGAVGQTIGGQTGAQIGAGLGAGLQGGPNAGANFGGAVGQTIGGQTGGQIGAGIGAAIGQGQ